MENSGERGLQASVEGFAHEHIVAGILMKKFKNVSLVDLPLSPYDIIIVFKEEDGKEDIIRAQVKTAKKSLSFIGGTRGELTGYIFLGSRNINSPQRPLMLLLALNLLIIIHTICILSLLW